MSKSKRQIKAKPLVKALKKSWYSLVAPALFNKQILGQSLVAEPTQLLNKVIVANAMNLTGDMKKQQVTVTFNVDEIKDGQGLTSVIAFEINSAYIKRLVRRNRNKLDMSFNATTKDNIRMRVKPVLFTKTKTSSGICAALRKKTHDFLLKQLKTMTFEEIIQDLLLARLQIAIRNEVKTIYPVKNAEIRMLLREQTREKTETTSPHETKQEAVIAESQGEVKDIKVPKRRAKPKKEELKNEAKEEIMPDAAKEVRDVQFLVPPAAE